MPSSLVVLRGSFFAGAAELRVRLRKDFDEAFASTQLPERPDYAWANEFLLKARKSSFPHH